MLNFERIELLGFKSFADKVKIDLLDGITAIVGPNGCGKSNVADAIRWVLGEQSAKTLRGSSMQDVIFNGTQSRKSLSYCEVSLYFNNSEKIFPSLDYTEVVMTRKLYRSGESEYYLNRQPCRMRDLINLLHECGVSKEGYTIIGQGKVSEILSSKPEDRRAIFEEAVGIAKTKKDRNETINKLARTNDNITRVSDIITERERQLEPLRKQAEKTRANRALSEQLKHHEINTYLYKYENASETKRKINDRIKGLTEEIEARRVELNETIALYNSHLDEVKHADEFLRAIANEITDRSVDIEKQSGEAKVFAEKISFFRSENERLSSETAKNTEKISENETQLKNKKSYTVSCNKEIDALTKKSAEISKKIAELSGEITRGEDLAESVQNEVIKSVEGLADMNKNLGAISAEESVISSQQKSIVDKVNALVDKCTALMLENDENKKELASLEEFISNAKLEVKDKEDSVSSTNNFIEQVTNKLLELERIISEIDTRLKFTLGVKDSYAGYNEAIKRLMEATKQDKNLAQKVKGVVAEIMSTDKKYELAVEKAIGGAIQNVVTETSKDTEYLISYLKKSNIGRITFLPIETVKVRGNGGDLISAINETGSLGLATDIVKYDTYYENIVKHLLGGTLIVDNLQNARQIAHKYHFNFKIVTLEGDVIATSGSMTGGAQAKHSNNLLTIDRQIAELTQKITERKNEFNLLSTNKQNLLKQVNEKVDELNALNESLFSAKQKSAILREKLVVTDKVIQDTQLEIEKYKDDIAVISQRLSEISLAYTDINKGNEELNRQKETASKEQSQHREMFTELRKQRDEVLKENTSVQSRLSYLRSEIAGAEADIERLGLEIENLNTANENNKKVTESNLKIIEGLIRKAEEVSLNADDKKHLEDLRKQQAEFDSKKERLNELIAQDNLKREVLQADIDKNSERKASEEVNYTKVDTELDFMSQNIFTEYQLTYETCLPLRDENYEIATSQQEISTLKRKIAALGSINPNAIEEYNELSEAYNELVSQRDDLYKAQDDLQKVIDDLTKEMTLTFNEGFKTIRSNFSKIFKELFGGGSADLVVEESTTGDPLDAGIEIVAEPPGKKLQKISLLSGGEMSLTAIAILFAILRLRPMPFCVLDEIEAALDDANVARFAKYLKNFAKETQFICITHKKVTMENADGLFGVTMPEKGVSSIVSVKLSDAIELERKNA
ncbi:MAG: chromosome segregation protein SMC [Clostridia bacterium]|nr:chromosome segregation protein SMC [Clostridia bacterium]